LASREINWLVFMHIPKTGGTSVHEFLVKDLKLRAHPARHSGIWKEGLQDLKTYELFSAHMLRKDIEHLKKLGRIFLVTLFRDPVERYISEYDFLRTRPEEEVRQDESKMLLRVRGQTPEDFFGDIIARGIDNKITRTIAGHKDLTGTDVEETLAYFEAFDLVGVSNYLDEWVELIMRALERKGSFRPRFSNSSNSFVKQKGVGTGFERTSREVISEDMWNSLTWADKQLYNHFKAKFEAEHADKIFEKRVEYAKAFARLLYQSRAE
jgi:hypothetical protein